MSAARSMLIMLAGIILDWRWHIDEGIVNSVDILSENGHYVAYVNGAVYCTADTYGEAVRELTNDGII